MKISDRRLGLISVLGATLLLSAWLFQQLYAESTAAQRAAIAEVDLKTASHEAAIPILKALKSLAGDDTKVQQEVQSLEIENLFIAVSRYGAFDFRGLCKNRGGPARWIDNPVTNDERCSRLKYILDQWRPEQWIEPGARERLAALPDVEFQKELDRIHVASNSLVAESISIKKEDLKNAALRNRVVFLALYILGSVLGVGAQVLKIVRPPKQT